MGDVILSAAKDLVLLNHVILSAAKDLVLLNHVILSAAKDLVLLNHVILSAAKDLATGHDRPFAALRVTGLLSKCLPPCLMYCSDDV
jgi:hypothetical protein